MSFNGIWMWDVKYGVPESINDIKDFKEKLYELPDEYNQNFHNFAKFFSKFNEEASQITDDAAVTDYIGWLQGEDNQAKTEVIHCFDFLPEDIDFYYIDAIIQGALSNNLVVYNGITDEIYSAGDYAPDPNFQKVWHAYIKDVLEVNTTDDDILEPSLPKAKKLIGKVMKEKFLERGVKVRKSGLGFYIIKDGVTLDLTIFLDSNKAEMLCAEKLELWLYCYVKVSIHKLSTVFKINYFTFYKVPFIREEVIMSKYEFITVYKKSELFAYLEQFVDMFMFFEPHVASPKQFYDFLVANKEHERIKEHDFEGLDKMDEPQKMSALARFIEEDNIEALEEHYREEFIEYRLRDPKRGRNLNGANPREAFGMEFDENIAGYRFSYEFFNSKEEIMALLPDKIRLAAKPVDFGEPPYLVRILSRNINIDELNEILSRCPDNCTIIAICENLWNRDKIPVIREDCVIIQYEPRGEAQYS